MTGSIEQIIWESESISAGDAEIVANVTETDARFSALQAAVMWQNRLQRGMNCSGSDVRAGQIAFRIRKFNNSIDLVTRFCLPRHS